MQSPLLRPLLILAAACLLLASCSSDDSGSVTAETAGTSTTAGPAASTTTTAVDPSTVEAMPSAGCSADATVAEADSIETLTVRGEERQYQRHLPPAHDGNAPVPLVLDFHGYSEGAQIHAMHSKLGPFGDEEGFVTITPQGQGAIPFWDIAADSADIEFTGQILDAEEEALCVDTNRIYATGLSNGAFMTSSVACVFEDRIAAAAPVAGIRDPADCAFDRPVPVIAFHGTDDTFVTYEGGLGPSVDDLPSADGSGETLAEAGETSGAAEESGGGDSVPELTASWAERNGCESEPSEASVADDVTLIEFECPADGQTELYRVDGGGHTWPGSDFSAQIEDVVGTTTFSIDANELMWAFFQAHPLSRAG